MLSRRHFMLGLAAGFSLTACGKKDDSVIRIGAYLSLSGADSTFGSDTKEGIEIALAETNGAGGIHGKKIKVIYADDKSTTQEASQKVRRLIDRDKVVALLGEVASSRSLAGGLIANTRRIPMITPSSTSVEVTQGREWVFRTCFTDEQQGRGAARFIVDNLKKRKVGVFFAAQDTYSSGLARTFRDELKRLGGEIVIDKGYQKGETNFRTYLAELKAQSPEMIFVPNYYGEMVLIARQAKEIGIPGSCFVGGDGWDSNNLIEGAGAELDGAFFTNNYAPDVPWPSSKRFLEAFRAKYDRDPTSLAAQSYDSALVLFDAIRRAPAVTPDAIRRALLETKDFQGATGAITFGRDRNANKPVVVVEIKDRKFTYKAQYTVE